MVESLCRGFLLGRFSRIELFLLHGHHWNRVFIYVPHFLPDPHPLFFVYYNLKQGKARRVEIQRIGVGPFPGAVVDPDNVL